MVRLINSSITEFENQIKKSRIICLCAGNELMKLCENYPVLLEKIVCIKDNFKFGKSFNIQGRYIPIVPICSQDNYLEDSMIIISSILYAKDIVLQLDGLEIYDGKEIIVPYVLEDNVDILELDVKQEMLIPKKIHYCWFGNNEMPEQFLKNIESWKRFCPDYEIIRWDESNYDINKCDYMRQAYEVKKWGFVPDYARLDIVNTHGGIYLDTDVEVLKSLDELLKFDLFCGFESQKFVAFGLGFGGKANHPILEEMMRDYEKTDFMMEDGELNITASPVYQTNVLLKHGLVQNGRSQSHKNYVVFSKEYFAPFNPYGYGYISDITYSFHQYAATWFDEKQKAEKQQIKDSIDFIMKRMKRDS